MVLSALDFLIMRRRRRSRRRRIRKVMKIRLRAANDISNLCNLEEKYI